MFSSRIRKCTNVDHVSILLIGKPTAPIQKSVERYTEVGVLCCELFVFWLLLQVLGCAYVGDVLHAVGGSLDGCGYVGVFKL